MSDYGRLQEENTALKAENERLRAKILEMKVEISDASRPLTVSDAQLSG